MNELSSGHRKYLRSQAHHLRPVVMVGKHGVTDTLVQSVDEALEAHELIKLKFIEHKTEKPALCAEIGKKTRSHLAGIIGHVAIFYRQHPDQDKRKIMLPMT